MDNFIANIRYAQHKSMVTGKPWRVKIFQLKKRYFIDNDSNDNNLPVLPYGKNPVEINDLIKCNVCEFYFDFYGRPIDKLNNLIKKRINIIINFKTVIIEPYTGGIYVK